MRLLALAIFIVRMACLWVWKSSVSSEYVSWE